MCRVVESQLAVTLMPYFRRSGHCSRCEACFDPDETAFMVREGAIVGVCKKCMTDEEGEDLKLLLLAFPDQTRRRHIETTCGGCGRRIMTVAKLRKGQRWPVRACSGRCTQRMRRRPAGCKRWHVERKCRCGELFMPKRSDAIYCSPACKQLAYRLRIGRSGRAPIRLCQKDELEEGL
jgi:hypothetical protein